MLNPKTQHPFCNAGSQNTVLCAATRSCSRRTRHGEDGGVWTLLSSLGPEHWGGPLLLICRKLLRKGLTTQASGKTGIKDINQENIREASAKAVLFCVPTESELGYKNQEWRAKQTSILNKSTRVPSQGLPFPGLFMASFSSVIPLKFFKDKMQCQISTRACFTCLTPSVFLWVPERTGYEGLCVFPLVSDNSLSYGLINLW